jgi:hypothetical protein
MECAPISPATEAVLTMEPPPCRSICWISYFRQSQTPLALTAMIWSNSASVTSMVRTGVPSIPALLKAMSRRPYCPHHFIHQRFSTCAAWATSVWMKTAVPPASADHLHRFLPTVRVQVGDGQAGTVLGEENGRFATNAGTAASDQSNFAV